MPPTPTEMATRARLRELAAEIRALQRVVKEARGAASFGPAVAGLKAVSQLKSDVSRYKAALLIHAETDPLKRVQMQRHLALSKGAHVPAQHLVALEADLIVKLAQAQAMHAQAEMSGLTPGELVEIIVGAIDALPDADVARIREACERHGKAGPGEELVELDEGDDA